MKRVLKVLNIVCDVLETVGVLTSYAVLFPISKLVVLPQNLALKVRYLAPRGLMGSYFQAKFRRLLNQPTKELFILHQILKAFEKEFASFEAVDRPSLSRFMQSLYEEHFTIYMALGDFDQAMGVILRAHSHIGVTALPICSQLNIQTAQIIKAGIAAGRLLDDDSLKGIFQAGSSIIIKAADTDYLKMRTAAPGSSETKRTGKEAKILPFRRPETTKV